MHNFLVTLLLFFNEQLNGAWRMFQTLVKL